MEIAGYSYTFSPITAAKLVDHPQINRWYSGRGMKSLEMYDLWIKHDAEIQIIIDALGSEDMQVCVCDVECHVVSRNPDARKAGTDKFHQRPAVANKLAVPIVLILPYLPNWNRDFRAQKCQEWLATAIEQSLLAQNSTVKP